MTTRDSSSQVIVTPRVSSASSGEKPNSSLVSMKWSMMAINESRFSVFIINVYLVKQMWTTQNNQDTSPW